MRRSMRDWKTMPCVVALCLLASCDTVSDTTTDVTSDAASNAASDAASVTAFLTASEAASITASTGKLRGFLPTCLEPDNVEKAQAAADRGDFDAWRTLICVGYRTRGTPVQVIGCGAVTAPWQVELFVNLAPPDDRLPNDVCEVEMFVPGDDTAIVYTHYMNIERTP